MRPALVLVLLLVPAVAPAQLQGSEESARTVNRVASAWFVRSLPLPAASAGVRYDFDPATATFVRDAAPLGQLFVERADPIGRGRFNVSGLYEDLRLGAIGGQDVGNLSDPQPFFFTPRRAVRVRRAVIDVDVHQFLGTATYGLTDDIDASLSMALAYSDMRVDVTASVAGPRGNSVISTTGSAKDTSHVVGFGDVLMRTRWRFLHRAWASAALGLLVRAPSGNETSFQGTGFWEVSPALYVSSRRFSPRYFGQFQLHANAGVDLNVDSVEGSDARWGAGVDWNIVEPFTIGLALLGRHGWNRITPPGFNDVPRCGPTVVDCFLGGAAARRPASPLFGVDGGRPDQIDLSFGGRVSVWRDTVIAFADVVVPTDHQGIRADIIPLAGVEVAF